MTSSIDHIHETKLLCHSHCAPQLIKFMIQSWPPSSASTLLTPAGASCDTEDDDDGVASDCERDALGPRMDLLSGMMAVQPASPTPMPSPRLHMTQAINDRHAPFPSPLSLSGSMMNGVWDMSCQEEEDVLNGILKKVSAKRAQLAASRENVNSSLSDVEQRRAAALHRSANLKRKRQECAAGEELAAAAGRKEALLLADSDKFRLGHAPLLAAAGKATDAARNSSAATRSACEMASSAAAHIESLQEKLRALEREIKEETVKAAAAKLVASDASALSLLECSAADAATAAVSVWEDGGKKADENYHSYKRDYDAENRDMHQSNTTRASECTILEGADGEECKRDALSVTTLASSRKRLSKLHQALLQWGANPARSGSCSASTSTSHGAHSGINALMFSGDSGPSPLTHLGGDVCSGGFGSLDGGNDPFDGSLLFDGSDALLGFDNDQ